MSSTLIDRSAMSSVERGHDTELELKNFRATKKQGRTYKGENYVELTYTKNGNETIGKIPRIVGAVSLGIVASALTLGLLNLSKDFRKFTWGNVVKTAKGNEPLIGGRAARFAAWFFGTIATVGFANLSSDFRDATISPAIHGQAERKLLFKKDPEPHKFSFNPATQTEFQQLSTDTGYDLSKPDNVRDYIEQAQQDGRARKIDNHWTVLEDDERMLFVPDGKMDQAQLIKIANKNGTPITNPEKLQRGAEAYCAHHEGNKEAVLLGYNPKDRVSIRKYIEKLITEDPKRVSRINGHLVVLEDRRPGVSSFLFVPDGNFEKATSIKFWHAKDGSTITNTDERWCAINAYCATYHTIESEWDKKATESAKTMASRRNEDPDDPNVIRDLKIEVKKSRRTVVISPREHHARIYGKVDPNKTNTGNWRTGTHISFDEGLSKELDTIYNKNLMERKGNLEGSKPYENRPEQPPAVRDLPAEDDQSDTDN